MRTAAKRLVPILLALLILTGCDGLILYDPAGWFGDLYGTGPSSSPGGDGQVQLSGPNPAHDVFDPNQVPPYSGTACVQIHENRPYFQPEELSADSFESYSELDALGRCGAAFARVCLDTMPTEERGAIGMIKPSGWHTVRYDCVDGRYLYNRCHLIGYQLTAENDNVNNLITGTRYLNMEGMLPFENRVTDYVKETEHHVAYRVTPIFDGDDLLARGVLMEGWSVEDHGEGICFCVFAYNVQPGIGIDYTTGNSWLMDGSPASGQNEPEPGNGPAPSAPDIPENPAPGPNVVTYIVNTNTKRFHRPDCSSVSDMKQSNKREYTGTAQELIDQGYSPCKQCNPL